MDPSVYGYEDFTQELSTLISTYPPPFIYICDPIALRTTISVLNETASACYERSRLTADPEVFHVHVDAIACFTQRLLFDTILNSLPNSTSSPDSTERWNDSWDSFLHGLQHLHSNQCEVSSKDVRFVISIEQAHRLKERLPDSIVPLTRLNELSQIDITVIFVSQTQWQDVKPALGASPEPYYIDPKPLSKSDIVKTLSARYASLSEATRKFSFENAQCYDPSLDQLYGHYIAMICDVCFPFTHDIDELAYIAAARWPGFVKPILLSSSEEEDIQAPSEDTRLRLMRIFNPTVTSALESLYPRLTNAADWAIANEPDANILDQPFGQLHSPVTKPGISAQGQQKDETSLTSLPRMLKFILVASYITSINPAKTDLRMFGRGLDEKKRKRRAGRVKTKTKGPSKIPQHLLGPSAFPVDRMIAILGALLEENDADSRLPAPELTIPGEYTDMEIGRVAVYSAVMELASMHLLLRTSQPDKIDGPPMFKSAISQDMALLLAKQLDIPLNDLLWETT